MGQGTFGQVRKIQQKKEPREVFACKTINVQKFRDEHTSLRMLYTEVCIQMELQKHVSLFWYLVDDIDSYLCIFSHVYSKWSVFLNLKPSYTSLWNSKYRVIINRMMLIDSS